MMPENKISIDANVRRQVWGLGAQSASRSAPMLAVAVIILVWIAINVKEPAVATLVALVGVTVSGWRYSFKFRYKDTGNFGDAKLGKLRLEMEGNAALAGTMWTICTIWIYPMLSGTTATVYVVAIAGSVALTAFFMSLVGYSFTILVGLQLGSLVGVSLLIESARSIPLAILATGFSLSMMKAANDVTKSMTLAVKHGLEAEAATALLSVAMKDAEAQAVSLRQEKEKAEAANITKSQILATMSHEIRTPMNGVIGPLDMLSRSQLTLDQRRLVRTAASCSKSLLTIVNDVLDFSSIEAGALRLVNLPTSLVSIANSVIATFQTTAKEKRINLSAMVDTSLPNVLTDSVKLKQVLTNLVGNAAKFTETGFITLRIQCKSHQVDSAVIGFEVQDSGRGIPESAFDTLFDPFTQVTDESKRRYGGTGLGLSICRRIVDAMGGQLTVSSKVGHGSLFQFDLCLDRVEADDQPIAGDTNQGSLDDSGVYVGRVLVVEDNLVNRAVARQFLTSLGLEVVEAEDGSEALKVLAGEGVDLVLMDCDMPVMDGYEATEVIRNAEVASGGPRLPIIALTAYATSEDKRKANEAGMDAYLAKPYVRQDLFNVLAEFLQRG